METEYEKIKELILSDNEDNYEIGISIAKSLNYYVDLLNEFAPLTTDKNTFPPDKNQRFTVADFKGENSTNVCNQFVNTAYLKILNAKNLDFKHLDNLQKLREIQIKNSNILNFSYIYENLMMLKFLDVNFDGFSSDIKNFKNLKTIQIENCKNLRIHEDISKLDLNFLMLANCGLTEFPNFIFEFENLSFLNLRGNSFTEIPKEIGNLKKLKTLILTDNNLKTLPIELGNLKNLEYLYVPKMHDSIYKQFANKLTKTKIIEN